MFFLQQMKDQLDNILLNGSLLEDFKVRARWVGWGVCTVTRRREVLLHACKELGPLRSL